MTSTRAQSSAGPSSWGGPDATNSGVSKAGRCAEWLNSVKSLSRARAQTTGSSQFKEDATDATNRSQGSPPSVATGTSAKTGKPKRTETLRSVKTKKTPRGGGQAQRVRNSELQNSSFIPDTIKQIPSSASDEPDTIFTLSDGTDLTLPSTLVPSDYDAAQPKRIPQSKTRTKHAGKTRPAQSSEGATKNTKQGGKGGTKNTKDTQRTVRTRTTEASAEPSRSAGVRKKKRPAKPQKRGRRDVPRGWEKDSQSGKSTD